MRMLLYFCCCVLCAALLKPIHALSQSSSQTSSASSSSAQTVVVLGSVRDSTKSPLAGARVVLLRGVDESFKGGTIPPDAIAGGAVSDKSGAFAVRVSVGGGAGGGGKYLLLITSVGYSAYRKELSINATNVTDGNPDTVRLGAIQLKQSIVTTDQVNVTERATRGEVRGDTTEFNANQFKTERNAAAEDLVRKLPGLEVQADGTVKAQGQNIQRVMVDGKRFFGDDPKVALKNLPAEIIDKVQVVDQMSDQSRFTGFDDGDRTKTLNIVTKPDKRNGQFGKLYAGGGANTQSPQARYTAGGNVNFFGGDRRISLIGMSNNINQQNFAIQDILGAMTGGGQARGMGAAMAGAARAMGGANQVVRMGGGGNVNPSDFMVQQSDGISASHALGVNYSDNWGKPMEVSGSYFVNFTDNVSAQDVAGLYFQKDSTQKRFEDNDARTRNLNHRLNFRFDYTIDSLNSLLFTPELTVQSNNRQKTSVNSSFTGEDVPLNASSTQNATESNGFTFNGELLYRHKFDSVGRTITASVRSRFNRGRGELNNDAVNTFFRNALSSMVDVDSLLQQSPTRDNGFTVGGNVSYTEPLALFASNEMLQVSYNVSQTRSEADRKLYDFNATNGEYDKLNPLLSNVSSSLYTTQRPGLTYRITLSTGMTLSVGAEYQVARLSVTQAFPRTFELGRDFTNILPSASFTMRIGGSRGGFGPPPGGRPPFTGVPPSGSGGAPPMMMFMMASQAASGPVGNFRVNYRAFTNQPSIRQLQTAVDNSDPLRLYVGNTDLRQELTHNVSANYGVFNLQNATSIFAFVSANFTSDKIANSTDFAARDTVMGEGIALGRGAQLTRPVNLDGYWSLRSFGGYSFPWEPAEGFKMNITTNGGVTYTRDVTLINGAKNFADNIGLTPSLGVSSNVSENLDFTLSARTSYNIVRNSIQQTMNNNYFTHSIFARVNWIFGDGFLVAADFNYLANVGLSGDFNQAIPLLNVGVGKRLFDNNGELRLSVFDALNQNTSIVRNVTASAIEDVQTNVLQRYVLLTFTYNLRAFGA